MNLISPGPYPPMPKSDLARRGRVPVPEEEISSSDDDGNNQSATPVAATQPSAPPVVRPSRQIRVTAKSSEGSLEWEKVSYVRHLFSLRSLSSKRNLLHMRTCVVIMYYKLLTFNRWKLQIKIVKLMVICI